MAGTTDAGQDKIISCWNELQDELFADSWNADIGRYRSRFAYRGLSDAAYPLATTLKRLRGSYSCLEKHLLRNFKKYAHQRVVENDSFWNWLAGRNPAIFFEPPSIDDRIINQFAFFSVLPDPCWDFDCWLRQHPGLWRRIIIPGRLKWEIRDKLDQANITERVLFPGLDGLSRWLSRHYSPRDIGTVIPLAVGS